jgi:hypothetical protein
MKAFLVVLVLLVVGGVGFAFYEGWFRLSTENTDHKPSVSIGVDEDKIQADKKKAENKIESLENKAKDKTADPADNVKQPKNGP